MIIYLLDSSLNDKYLLEYTIQFFNSFITCLVLNILFLVLFMNVKI